MTDFNPNPSDAPQPSSQQEQPPTAFCQNCGKALHADTVRRVGPAVYCEPCLAARLAGAPAGYPPPGNYSAGTHAPYPPAGGAPAWVPGPPARPNANLAALLGFIPGVGAMYNEQYAKGIVHLMVFAVLVTFSHIAGIFGLFILGWEAYMVIEAHHTAEARRDGTPLPNPFGLNEIGERFGFGRAWPSGTGFSSATHPYAGQTAATAAADAATQAGTGNPDWNTVPPAGAAGSGAGTAGWGAPTDTYASTQRWAADAQTYAENLAQKVHQQVFHDTHGGQVPPAAPPYAPVDPAYGAAPFTPPFTAQPYTAHVFTPPPFVPPPFVPPPLVPQPSAASRNRFPAGAVWLIGLGVLFLLATTGIFNSFRGEALVGFGMIGLGSWLFVHRMLGSGPDLADDGTPMYKMRLLGALRSAVWVVTVGILFLLDNFRILYWHNSWPWLIIVAGLMALLQRAAYNSVAARTPFAPEVSPEGASAAYPGGSSVPPPSHSTGATDVTHGGI